MVNSNKILTVSYGTFSCTLEGFDDSFDTMKAIAEYFRDLAADDRYFGAEPPTPDAEMLARIAEREISRRVEARQEQGGIVLRPSLVAPQGRPGPQASRPEDAQTGDGQAEKAAPAPEAKTARTETPPAHKPEPAPAPDTESPAATETPAPAETASAEDVDDTAAAAPEEAGAPIGDERPEPQEEAARAEPQALDDHTDASEERSEDVAADTPAADETGIAGSLAQTDALTAVAPESPEAAIEPAADEVADTGIEAEAAEHDAVDAEASQDEIAEDEIAEVEVAAEDHGAEETASEEIAEEETPEAEAEVEAETEAEAETGAEAAAQADDETEAELAAPAPAADRLSGAPLAASAAAAAAMAADLPRRPAAETEAAPAPRPEITHPDPQSIAAKLQRIRAAVAGSLAGADDGEDTVNLFTDDGRRAESGETGQIAARVLRVRRPEPEADTVSAVDPGTSTEDSEADVAADEDLQQAFAALEAELGAAPAGAAELDAEGAVEPTAVADAEDVAADEDDLDGWDTAAPLGDAEEEIAYEEEIEVSEALVVETIEAEDPSAGQDAAVAETEAPDTEATAEDEREAGEPVTDATPPAQPAADDADTDPDSVSDALAAAARRASREPETARRGEVTRLLDETEGQMDKPEASRRRSAIAHLRAAVAATRAEPRHADAEASEQPEEAYRADLADAVRPRRPGAGGHRTPRPEESRPAPLKLVAEQRVDAPAEDAGPIRPRRVTAPAAEAEDPNGFIAYVEELGVSGLPDLLEAAAAYLAHGAEDGGFSRPQLMAKLRDAQADGFSREEGLRHFGQLLREGKIVKRGGGRFGVSDDISYQPGARAAG
ncbi:hypothetical protein [Rhodosalinus sp. 5P4]|uniref:hypothetical protein n=1 Tax=Rhodosalinus sp. 5P4 TaxID=3239196 RepID=UPI003523BE35